MPKVSYSHIVDGCMLAIVLLAVTCGSGCASTSEAKDTKPFNCEEIDRDVFRNIYHQAVVNCLSSAQLSASPVSILVGLKDCRQVACNATKEHFSLKH